MAESQEDVAGPADDERILDERVSKKRKLALFLCTHWHGLVCIFTPLILLAVLAPFPPEKYQWCAYTLLLMAIFWVTECIPLPLTSFLPVVIFPLTDVMDTRTTCRCYMNDTVLMFFGSMLLAYAVEQSGLHKRLALCVIRLIGYSHYRLLFAMSITTMFVSMWITNTAATTMMVPINFALLKVFEDQNLLNIYEMNSNGEMVASDMTTCYFCAATFSATIGGIGTLVGTATNLVFKGLFQRVYPAAPEYLSFPKFSAFAIPYMLVMEMCVYLYMIIIYLGFLSKILNLINFLYQLGYINLVTMAPIILEKDLHDGRYIEYIQGPSSVDGMEMRVCYYATDKGESYILPCGPNSKAAKTALIPEVGVVAAKNAVNENWKKLGKITFWEIMVIILFSGAMVMFFCRCPQIFHGWGDYISDYYGLKDNKFVRDSAAALFVGFLMLLLPSTLAIFKNCSAKDDDLPKGRVTSVLDWVIMNEIMPYSFMFLLGAGIALSEAAKKEYSDLNEQIGNALRHLSSLPNYFIILLIIIATVFITNFASNVAVCNVIAPIAMQLAKEINVHPLWYNIAAGFSASFCYCLPVGTPGNLVIQSAANIPTMKMIKAGLGPTIITIFLTWMSICFWAPIIWPDLLTPSELTWLK